MNRRLVISITIAVSFVCIMADICVPISYFGADGPYTGRVVELETGEPIEGAVVAAEWILEYGTGIKSCYKETFTDKNGEFELHAVDCIAPVYVPPSSRIDQHRVVIFKPGYLGYPPIKEKKSLYTGVKFDKDHRHNVIKLDKAVTLGERSQTLNKATSFSFLGNRNREEAYKELEKEPYKLPHKVIFERKLPNLSKITKQEDEYLRNEWEQIMKESYKGEPVIVPPMVTPHRERQPIKKNKGGNNEE
ncbi:MAG: hypothetical protein HQL02_11055 [Nitrospirae bacterium]|nr:hypothetical protein [Nitrospirota bacterium]